MENKKVNITREELEDFMRQIEGIKSTIEILQNKELIDEIEGSENLKKQSIKPIKLDI